METASRQSGNSGEQRVKRSIGLLLFSLIYSAQQLAAQADIQNVKKSLSAIEKEQDRLAHEEFMSYIYMTIGFLCVIAIAWFTTAYSKKRSKREMEERQKMILKAQELKKHGHHHGHAAHHHARK